MGYVARENKIDRAREVIAVLKKEWALFRKEHREALIDGDLRLVRFNLAEIGIDRGVKHEAVVQDKFRIEADLGLQRLALERRMVRVPVIDIAEPAQQSVRNELNVAGRRNVLDARRCRGLVKSSLDAVRDTRPEQIFVRAR